MITNKGIAKSNGGGSPWCPFPDDKMLAAFKGFLERWPTCPLCGGRYGFLDYSKLLDKDFRINCLKKTHFQAEIKHDARKGKDQVYFKKKASFALFAGDYSVSWDSGYPNKVHVSFFTGVFDRKRLKLNFGDIDRWFISEAQLKENLDKYRILV